MAGIAKLADPTGFRNSATQFGLPPKATVWLGIVLPTLELVIAALLLPVVTAWWAALTALGLLFIFLIAIATSMARGRRPDCHCFGQIYSEPISWRTFTLDCALMGIAGLVVWHGPQNVGPSALVWITVLSTGQAVSLGFGAIAIAAVAIQSLFLVQLFGQHGRLLLRLDALEEAFAEHGLPVPVSHEVLPQEGLPVGALAPVFKLSNLIGAKVTLESLLAAGHPVLLIFSDPNCGPCSALVPDFNRWHAQYKDALTLAILSRASPEENRSKFGTGGLIVLLQEEREVATAYLAFGTPAAVVVHPDGTIGSGLVSGADAIRRLVARTVGSPVALPSRLTAPLSAAPKPGNPAPNLEFSDLEDRPVRLYDYRNRNVVLLFWNPTCSFCSELLPRLRAWEAVSTADAPELLVISVGTVDLNREMHLRSRVVLDPGFRAGRAFGVNGTPAAVLIGANGKIMSPPVVGASSVLALLGSTPDVTALAS